jgi:CRISPR-associated protein (TIGR03986 family)
MANIVKGFLVWQGEGDKHIRRVKWQAKKGLTNPTPFDERELAAELRSRQEDEIEVDLELTASGRPMRIRPAGKPWAESQTPIATPQPSRLDRPPRRDDRRRSDRQDRRPQQRDRDRQQDRGPVVELKTVFHNPYNFIPAPPRKTDHEELGDHAPEGHDCYVSEMWSGRIAVKLTTQTPLLALDAARVELYGKDDHKIFPMRVGADGKPYLPPTSIKGMLRSAYEAVTNSRLGVFENHQDRLAYRMEAKIGPEPARVEERNGRLGLRIMRAPVMGYAAKLPRYRDDRELRNPVPRDKGESYTALRYPSNDLPQHGDPVWVFLDNGRVQRIERRLSAQAPGRDWQAGWVCVTGPNINKKRFERVFLEALNDRFIPITDKHENLWRELIQNYKDTHERDLKKRERDKDKPQDYLGNEPGKTGWSRHIYEPGYEYLREGTLCYVESNGNEVQALIPVTISRRLFAVSPESLLHDSLKPAKSIDKLSPADRVFGWVNQSRSGAYRGQLRIGPVQCVSPDPIEHFKNLGLPLAILGQPKPQQARFYVARSMKGEAQHDGLSKEQAGYLRSKGLRVRKVYPHHADLPSGYWKDPWQDHTQQSDEGFFQEYRRPHKPQIMNGRAKLNREGKAFELLHGEENEQRDDQNRSIRGWVKPGTVFEFEIDVVNLSRLELGALLWLLSLDPNHYHRLGGGKPLGFGSVRLEIDWGQTNLRIGAQWRESYATLDKIEKPEHDAALDCIKKFQNEMAQTYGKGGFDQVSFIAAFKRCAEGFKDRKPIHYPRAKQKEQQPNSTIPPHPEGKAFEWFVANERTGKFGGPKLPLPDLANDGGLPILENPVKPNR